MSFKVLQKCAELQPITQKWKKNVKSSVFALCWSSFSNGSCVSDSGKHIFLLVNAAFLQLIRTENQKWSGKGRVERLKAAISGGGNAPWKSVRKSSITLHCSIGKKKKIAWRCFQNICLKGECWGAKRGLVSGGKDISFLLIWHFLVEKQNLRVNRMECPEGNMHASKEKYPPEQPV